MVLVTGGTGLVGSHLLYELTSRDSYVRALKRKTSNINQVRTIFKYYTNNADELFSKIEWVEGDILDPVSLDDAMNEGDMVYHAAAMVSFVPAMKRKIFQNNITGTANVVNTCLNKKIAKLCHVSSVATLGSSEDNSPVTENLIWSPSKKHSNYSISKFHSEMEVWRGIEEGLNAVIVNPSIILGPGNWASGSSALFSEIYKGLKFYTPGITGYVDVRDVVKSMIQLMESDLTAERFILNSENATFEKVFKSIGKTFNKVETFYELKRWMTNLAWRVEKVKSIFSDVDPKITRETVASGFMKSNYSNEKIMRQFNYSFIPIEQSITEICKIFLKQNKGAM